MLLSHLPAATCDDIRATSKNTLDGRIVEGLVDGVEMMIQDSMGILMSSSRGFMKGVLICRASADAP